MTLNSAVLDALDDLSEMIGQRGGTVNVRVYLPAPKDRVMISEAGMPLVRNIQEMHWHGDAVDGDSDRESGSKVDTAAGQKDEVGEDCVAQRDRINAVDLARYFHDRFETLAPLFKYPTRQESRVHWDYVPEDNKALMIAVAAAIIAHFGFNN